LKDVREIRLGQKTSVFQKNPVPEYEALSFSLIYGGDRTLDIICKDKKEFETWVGGLKSLTLEPQSVDLSTADTTRVQSERDRLSVVFRGSTTIVQKREGLFSKLKSNSNQFLFTSIQLIINLFMFV
jgi:hypothetical protein